MIRAVVWLIGVVVVAGIVHIVTVFGVPHHAVRDPWNEIAAIGPTGRFVILPREGRDLRKPPAGLDPTMAAAACRFDLDGGPIRLKASAPDVYWSLSLYDRRGLSVWSLDNRASGGRGLDVLVASDVHVAQLRENPPEELEDIVIVDWKGREGIALLQIFAQQGSLLPEIAAALGAAECKASPLS